MLGISRVNKYNRGVADSPRRTDAIAVAIAIAIAIVIAIAIDPLRGLG
jgi:hypothetical protein